MSVPPCLFQIALAVGLRRPHGAPIEGDAVVERVETLVQELGRTIRQVERLREEVRFLRHELRKSGYRYADPKDRLQPGDLA